MQMAERECNVTGWDTILEDLLGKEEGNTFSRDFRGKKTKQDVRGMLMIYTFQVGKGLIELGQTNERKWTKWEELWQVVLH